MSIPLAYGLVAQGLIAAAVVRVLCELLMRPHRSGATLDAAGADPTGSSRDLPRGVAWAVVAVPLVLLLPMGQCTVAERMRGIWGDPSVTTCALLALFVARPARLPRRPSRALSLGLTLLVTIPLYGPILGAGLPVPDLYAIGWSPYALLIVIAAAAWLLHVSARWCSTWALIMTLGLLMYAIRAMESSNLLDYLIDPGLLLAIAAMAVLPRGRASAPEARTGSRAQHRNARSPTA